MKPEKIGELLLGKELVFLSKEIGRNSSKLSNMELDAMDKEVMPAIDNSLSYLKEKIEKEKVVESVLTEIDKKLKVKDVDNKKIGEIVTGKELVYLSKCFGKPEDYLSDKPISRMKSGVETQLNLSKKDIKKNSERLSILNTLIKKLKQGE